MTNPIFERDRIKSLTAAKIKKTVDDLLKGEWADKTSAFHFATSFDLQDTKLDAAIRQQTERLAIGAKARTTPDICCLARDLRHFLRHAHGDRALRCSPGPAVHHTGICRSPIAAPPSDRARCTCYPSACRPLQPPARGYGQ
jgi:hypothetical protein